jgi:hypothetical protein
MFDSSCHLSLIRGNFCQLFVFKVLVIQGFDEERAPHRTCISLIACKSLFASELIRKFLLLFHKLKVIIVILKVLFGEHEVLVDFQDDPAHHLNQGE